LYSKGQNPRTYFAFLSHPNGKYGVTKGKQYKFQLFRCEINCQGPFAVLAGGEWVLLIDWHEPGCSATAQLQLAKDEIAYQPAINCSGNQYKRTSTVSSH